MNAYKFLRGGRVAPFSGRTWPERGWVEADGDLRACRNGVHACRARDLSYWLFEELWEVELGGETRAAPLKIVAQRGRLARRVEGWDTDLKAEFALACALRLAKHAADECREAGLGREAQALDAARELADVRAAADEAGTAAEAAGARPATRLASYASDGVGWAETLPPSGVAYVAAHAADSRSRTSAADAFADERLWQARWLIERLGLRDDE